MTPIAIATELPPFDPSGILRALTVALLHVLAYAMVLFVTVALVVGLVISRETDRAESRAERGPSKTALETIRYAYVAFPQWAVDHPDRACPATLRELDRYLIRAAARDPWGREYMFTCGDGRLYVMSLGPDGVSGNADDIWSHQ